MPDAAAQFGGGLRKSWKAPRFLIRSKSAFNVVFEFGLTLCHYCYRPSAFVLGWKCQLQNWRDEQVKGHKDDEGWHNALLGGLRDVFT